MERKEFLEQVVMVSNKKEERNNVKELKDKKKEKKKKSNETSNLYRMTKQVKIDNNSFLFNRNQEQRASDALVVKRRAVTCIRLVEVLRRIVMR